METTEFDRFFTAYVQAALWSSPAYVGEEDSRQDDSLQDAGFAIESLAPETRAAMMRDCAKFCSDIYDLLHELTEKCACDFWLTRNRHGAGFWDSPDIWGYRTDELTQRAREFPEVDLYIGDDGLIYQCSS